MFYVADTGNNRVLLYQFPSDDPTPAWGNMTNRIAVGDISGAVLNFCGDTADNYSVALPRIGGQEVCKCVS
jgi:sugar lactone lactonase YvrE